MKIFVVTGNWAHEPGSILGIAKTQKGVEKLKDADKAGCMPYSYYDVAEFETDDAT